MLYLECIYQTAEVKYCAVILLIESVKSTLHALIVASADSNKTHLQTEGLPFNPTFSAFGVDFSVDSSGVGGVMKWTDVVSYLDRVLSTCYVNVACSMVHHSVRLRMIDTATGIAGGSNVNTTITTSTPTSVLDLVGDASHTPLHYINAGLRVCDSVSARFRKLYVLEKMHRYTLSV